MTQKRLFSPLFLVASLPILAQAEFNCLSEISFKVQGSGQAVATTPDTSKGQVPPKNEALIPGPERNVFFSTIEDKGDTEDLAKEKLQRKIPQEKERALKFCSSNYENLAGCLASKYASMDSVISTLDFKARTELQKAIAGDCKAQSGRCLDATASEAKCKEIVVKEAVTPEAGKGKEAAGAADKGKKGKK